MAYYVMRRRGLAASNAPTQILSALDCMKLTGPSNDLEDWRDVEITFLHAILRCFIEERFHRL